MARKNNNQENIKTAQGMDRRATQVVTYVITIIPASQFHFLANKNTELACRHSQ